MKKLLLTMLLLTLIIPNVSADYGNCTDQEISIFSSCVGWNTFDQYWHIYGYCQQYDYNNDLIINLSDLAYFAQSCYGG